MHRILRKTNNTTFELIFILIKLTTRKHYLSLASIKRIEIVLHYMYAYISKISFRKFPNILLIINPSGISWNVVLSFDSKKTSQHIRIHIPKCVNEQVLTDMAPIHYQTNVQDWLHKNDISICQKLWKSFKLSSD